MFHGSTLVGD